MHTYVMFLILLIAWVPGNQSQDKPKPITPAEAIKQIGKPQVVVTMTVKKAKERLEKRGISYLDSEEDFKHPDNLGIALSAEAARKFKEQGIADPAAHFLGKVIQVKGCVMKFEERVYLPVHDPAQISLVEKKK